LKYLVDRGLLVRTSRARDAIADELDKRLKFHAVALARIVKLPDSTFSLGPPDFAKRFLRALNPIGRNKAAS
jgi:hypothetical protein